MVLLRHYRSVRGLLSVLRSGDGRLCGTLVLLVISRFIDLGILTPVLIPSTLAKLKGSGHVRYLTCQVRIIGRGQDCKDLKRFLFTFVVRLLEILHLVSRLITGFICMDKPSRKVLTQQAKSIKRPQVGSYFSTKQSGPLVPVFKVPKWSITVAFVSEVSKCPLIA